MANKSEKGIGAYKGGIPLNVTLHAWPIPKPGTNLRQMNETNYINEKTSESAKNYTNTFHNLNATGYVAIDDDLTETGLTDVQTFILAGVATVLPLLVIVITILGIRFLWKKYKEKTEEGYEGVLQKEESSEPLRKLQSFSLPQELKTSESQFTVSPDDIISTPSTQLPTSKSNGSVITMTLKNNHLIVETEETPNPPEGIKIESKGTTTKFVTSKAPDFGFDTHTKPTTDNTNSSEQLSAEKDGVQSVTNHGALIHSAPEDTDYELQKGNSNTGLSQSDLSVSSCDSRNPSYRYGNQMGYDSGGYGYAEYCGYSTLSDKNTTFNQTGPKPHKIYIRGYSVTEQLDYYLSTIQAGSQQQFKDILMSDIQAREKRENEIKQEDNNKPENENSDTKILSKNNSSLDESTSKETHSKASALQSDNNENLPNNEVYNKKSES